MGRALKLIHEGSGKTVVNHKNEMQYASISEVPSCRHKVVTLLCLESQGVLASLGGDLSVEISRGNLLYCPFRSLRDKARC